MSGSSAGGAAGRVAELYTRVQDVPLSYWCVGVGVVVSAGVIYWGHRRKPKPGAFPVRPYESIPGLLLTSVPRFIAVLTGRAMFYPTLYWNLFWHAVMPRQRWWDRIDGFLVLGALPFEQHVAELYAEGVRGVVNTCEEYAGPLQQYEQYGIEQLHIPTVDYTPPTLEDIDRACEFIRRYAQQGQSVYIHCKAGRGRSATVVICYLIRYDGLTAQQAQHMMQAKRSHVSKFLYCRPVVLEYERRYGGKVTSQ